MDCDHCCRAPRLARVVLLMMCIGTLPGCSGSFLDANGMRHVFGPVLVGQTVDRSPVTLASAVELRSFGISVHEMRQGFALSFGYAELRAAGLQSTPVGSPAAAAAPGSAAAASVRYRLALYAALPAAATPAGQLESVEATGLSVISLTAGEAVAVGYQRERSLVLGDDVHLAGNPIVALDRIFDRAVAPGHAGEGG